MIVARKGILGPFSSIAFLMENTALCLVLLRRKPGSSPTMSAWVLLMPYVSDRRNYVRYGFGGNNYCRSGDCLARASRVKQVSHFRSIAYEEMDF